LIDFDYSFSDIDNDSNPDKVDDDDQPPSDEEEGEDLAENWLA